MQVFLTFETSETKLGNFKIFVLYIFAEINTDTTNNPPHSVICQARIDLNTASEINVLTED